MGTQYKSLLGLTEVIADSAEISNIDLEATNITGLTTSRITEGTNLYYTDARVSENPNVSSNTTHRERKDNPHGVTAAQVGIHTTNDIIEGHNNLYYTDIRFDDRLATKTTTSLAEGANLYYTDARFDTRFGIKTTTDLTEGTNLYYTDARFDTQLATKSTTDLTEGANLYYTDARFDTRLATKTTTDLTEGANLYYTTTRANADFDTRFGIKTTTDLTEGTNLYYTDVRFDNRFGIKTTTDLTEGANLYYTDVRFDNRFGIKSTTDLIEGANLYYTDARFDTRLATKTTTDLTEGANLYYTTTRANADFDARLATKTTTDLTEGANLYYTDARFDARLATKTTDDLTEGKNNIYYTEARVSANTDVKANTAYTAVGHLPLSGGAMTGEITWDNDIEIPTWSSNTVYTPSDDPNWSISSSSIYNTSFQTFKAFNKTVLDAGDCWISLPGTYNTGGAVNASTYTTAHVDGNNSYQGEWIQVRYVKKLRLTSFILTARSNNEYSKSYRLLGTNDDPNVNPSWTTLMASSLSWGSPGASQVLTPETRLGYYNTYRLLITQTSLAYCSISRFIPSFVLEGNTISNVFSINGTPVDTLIADVKTNTDYRAVGHLPLSGGTMTGDITFDNTSLFEIPALTSNTGNPDYIASASSELGASYAAWVGFDGTNNNNNLCWHSLSNDYIFDGTYYSYTGDAKKTVDGLEFKGEWLMLQTTSEFSLNQFYIQARWDIGNRGPGAFTVAVSSDGDNFTSVFSVADQTWTNNQIRTYDTGITQTVGTYFLLITNRVYNDTNLNIKEWRITFNDPSYIHSINQVLNLNGTNVDTLISDVKANTAYTAIGHLPLDGGTLTGDLSINGELNIGGEKITTGATNGLQLYGPSRDIGGPHIQAFVSTDDYPVFQQLNNSHGSIAMCFDAYADGFTWKSSSSGSNAIIYKSNTDLEFSYSSGIAAGGEVIWNAGFSMDLANGLVSFSNGVDVTGDLTFGDITQFEMPILTSNTGNPDFIASASSEHSEPYQAWKAFNKSTSTHSTECWHISPYDYTGTNNDYNGDFETLVDGGLMGGQWLQLETTSRYYIAGFYLQSRGTTSTCSENFTVAVSDDGKNFTSIYSRVNQTWGANTARTYPNDATEITPTKGRYFRLITTRCYNSEFLTIKEWRITFETKSDIIDVNNINGVNVDTLIADVKTNSTKVSASGTINTHNDVNITTPADGHILTYTSGEWKNIAPAEAAGYLPLDGGTLTGDLNMGNNSIDNINQIFIDRNSALKNKIVLYDGGTPSTTAFYGFGIQSATLFYNVDSSNAHHKFYYGGTNEVFRIGDAGVYSYRDLDVKGNITVSGTVDGVDLKTLNTTANNAIPLAPHNTYVPTIGDGTNNFTLTSATGHYTVIGNVCRVSFYVLWTSKGSANGAIRLSLPFTSANGPYSSMALSAHNGIDSSLPSIGCFNLSATNYVVFFDKPTGLFSMNQTSFTNAGAICGSGFFYL